MSLAINKKKPEALVGKEAVKEETQKVIAEATATAPEYADGVLGSKSGSIAFVAPLGDPSHNDVTIDKEGNKTSTPYIVGYRFKALEDITVPECGLDEDARKNLMSFKDKNGVKQVKAGETFDLTRFETGLLLAPAEFNAKVTGEGKSFTGVYQSTGVKPKSGELGKVSQSAEIPTFALKADTGSIKDYQIIEVLSFEKKTLENGQARKIRTIKPGFEKWEPLCRVQAPKMGGSTKVSNANVRNAKAEAFLKLVNSK